jgi:calcyclin binding protein|tara:strand:- start:4 stop:870 length:867 start_codon:yes stop_codon:yes gene_type:complete
MASLTNEKTRVEHLKEDIEELQGVLNGSTLKSPRNIKYVSTYVLQLSMELQRLEVKIKTDEDVPVTIGTNEGYVQMADDDEEEEVNDDERKGEEPKTTSANTTTTTKKKTIKKKAELPVITGKWNPITTYGWDQSDKFVTVYVSGLDGVGSIPKDNVKCNFEEDAFDLTVTDLNGKSYRLNVSNLDKNINVKKSKVKIKASRVNVMLRKVDGKYGPDHWSDLRSKKSKESKDRLEKDPSAGIMDLMKDMYNSGDDKMKETIGKAMLESQKNRGKEPDLRTPGGDWGDM